MTATSSPDSEQEDTRRGADEAAAHCWKSTGDAEPDPVLEQLEWLQRTRAERLRDRLAWNQAEIQ